MGTLWSFTKQIKAPYVFDWEHGIALHAMQGNPASSRSEGEVSWFFSSHCRKLGYILKLRRGWPLKTRFCSGMAGLLSTYEGNLKNLHEAWQGNMDTSRGEVRDRVSLSSCTVIFGFLSIFKKSQASSPFEALNYACLSRCQRDVRPPVQMKRGPRAFSGASTGDSDSPSSCEMKDEPAFKPLQGNPAFF